jgi:RNA polymerase sigma-70 factor (sigma-E family)
VVEVSLNRYEGFQEFVAARGGALSRTAFLLAGDHHAAEDLVQSALAKAAARWWQIRDGGQPEAYVRRIMINEQISWWRRRPARPVAEVPERAGPDGGQRVLDRIVLDQALDRLSPRQRATVVLRFYEDLSEADTASVMDCSVGTVKRYTHEALTRLRESLPMLAEHAGQYADAGTALAAAKRRRTGRIAATAALGLALVAAVLIVLGPGLPGSDPLPPSSSPSPSSPRPSPSPPVLASLPSRLTDRSADAQPLPHDRGIGLAVLLMDEHDRRDGYLVAADGTWWQRPQTKPGSYHLSPDGRWLARLDEDKVVMRDLTGADEYKLPAAVEVRWAPSGGWLYGRSLNGPAWLASRDDWSPHQIDQDTARSVVAVTDAGELVCTAEGTTGTRIALRIITAATGQARHLTVDVAPQLGMFERPTQVSIAGVAGGIMTVIDTAAGNVAAIEFVRHYSDNDKQVYAGGIIEFSLLDGSVLRRVDLIGQDQRYGDVLCFHGGDLLWTDRLTLRAVRAGTATSSVIIPLNLIRWIYHPPGCQHGVLPHPNQNQ